MPLLNKLKELRSEKGLNQQELGSLVGVSRQTISVYI
ncbi:helix-turn-helix transcriptional regulator [Peptoniphilus asaccharolyticus]|nr:helix-turn-helix domain-containing protein [Peptoniphilus asaccharolyticus]MBL7576207.1 helix-turn-helix domain-containing protein [Peptoniphilus asaccharolyticus]